MGLPMTYYAVARWTGGGEDNPPVERLREILQELDVHDPEHPDCWLVHRETGWTLSAFSSGLLIWANDGGPDPSRDPEPDLIGYPGDRHMKGVSREKVLELWLKLAAGDIAAVEAEPWLPGSH